VALIERCKRDGPTQSRSGSFGPVCNGRGHPSARLPAPRSSALPAREVCCRQQAPISQARRGVLLSAARACRPWSGWGPSRGNASRRPKCDAGGFCSRPQKLIWRCAQGGDEAPDEGHARVTDLIAEPVRKGVDLDLILCGDSELCDQGQDCASYPGQSGPPPAAASRCISGAGSPACAQMLRSRKPMYKSIPARRQRQARGPARSWPHRPR
jgi:hypothetical protein